MGLPLYLAMTAAEMYRAPALPAHLGYMACHFSSYGLGLSNCPEALPEGSMLILNDRTPICGHDPGQILEQLAGMMERMACPWLLLDFQRPGAEETAALAELLAGALPGKVGVSDVYAEGLDCPVFLPPAPLHMPLGEHLAPWQGREIWLEAALDGEILTLTPEGADISGTQAGESQGEFADAALHCHYSVALAENAASFILRRTPEDVAALLGEAQALGVTLAVGLYQQLGDFAEKWTAPAGEGISIAGADIQEMPASLPGMPSAPSLST